MRRQDPLLHPFRRAGPFVLICLGAAIATLTGCKTPSEIKTASSKQIELIAAARDAAGDLQKGLDRFHRETEQTTLQEGRILIARAAINEASKKGHAGVTADKLFEISNKEVRPWVDNAFAEAGIKQTIEELQKRFDSTTNPLVKGSLQNDLDDLKMTEAFLAGKPKEIKALEDILQTEMNGDASQRERLGKVLQMLEAQLDVMGVLAKTVDDWLAVDVTISQDQMDALEKTVLDTTQALDKK